MCVSRQDVTKPVLGACKPLGVEDDPMHQEESGQMPGRLELGRVVMLREIRFPKPAGGGGVLSP
jgi:hypothetical protein